MRGSHAACFPGRLMHGSRAACFPSDCSPCSVQGDVEGLAKARMVVECLQKRLMIAIFHRWVDRTLALAGEDEGPVIVKKANTSAQRSARPGAARPADVSTQERDEHAALEEMGTTMRMQQEQIEQLKQEAKEENMRFIAKEYQWKEVKLSHASIEIHVRMSGRCIAGVR